MSVLDLHAFVDRSRALVDSAPPSTRRETRAWLVDPFLETLGWDVHADGCVTDVTVDETRLEYVHSVDGVPALFVAVEPFGDSLDKSRAVAVLETMAWTGVDRAIYTDGRDYLFLAGTTDADRLACRRSSLSAHGSAVAHYSRDTLGRRLERHSREFVARRLAIERASLVESIVDELSSASGRGDAYESEFESAADRFLERLVATFADGRGDPTAELEANSNTDVSVRFSEPTTSNGDGDRTADRRAESTDEYITRSDLGESDVGDVSRSPGDSSTTEEGDTATEADASVSAEVNDATDATDANDDSDRATDDADGDETTPGGEYVVRFFNDRGSVGAIGHSSPDRALVQTAEYLFERGLSGVTVPWSPDEDDDTTDARTVLNESPVRADGTPMTDPRRLSNGLYLEAAGGLEARASRVKALVARAGLRAMLTGDWERE